MDCQKVQRYHNRSKGRCRKCQQSSGNPNSGYKKEKSDRQWKLRLGCTETGYGGNKSEATLPGKGNNGEGSLANLKTVGGKGTSSGKNGKNESEEENKEKKLTAYAGINKKDSGKNGKSDKNEKDSTKKKNDNKTDKKTEEASTDDLTENKEKDKTSGVISGSSEKKEKSIPELVGSKVTNTWTHMRFLTKVLSVFALAGLIYLIFWTGARRSFRKMKNRNPSLQR